MSVYTDTTSKLDRPLRIAMVDYILERDKPGASGLSDIVWCMARELADMGDEVHVVAPYSVDPEPYPNISVHRFVPPRLGYRNIVGHVLIALRARKEIRKLGSLDFVHAPEYLSTGVLAPLLSTPVVLTTPGNIYERIASDSNPWDPITTGVLKLAARSSSRYCVMVNAISDDMGEYWRRAGAPAERVVVVPHGVDVSVFRPMDNAVGQLGLDPGKLHVVYVGRLSKEKNLKMLFEAVQVASHQIPNICLHVIGSGPLANQLDEEASNFGISEQVIFHGSIPKVDLPLWYSAAVAVVLPSNSEGLPRVMLEAMACGAVFIGTRISGEVDHIRDGENGYLVNPGCTQELIEQLILVLTSSSVGDAVGQRASMYVNTYLTWPIVVRRFRDAVRDHIGLTGQQR